MGREFASAAARWCALVQRSNPNKPLSFMPKLVAICDVTPKMFEWFVGNFPEVREASRVNRACHNSSLVSVFRTPQLRTYTDHHELLKDIEVEAIYCAVPHNLHQSLYVDIINSGKHLLGEKPFGINLEANDAITSTL
jgi:predicted dehydrogenase